MNSKLGLGKEVLSLSLVVMEVRTDEDRRLVCKY